MAKYDLKGASLTVSSGDTVPVVAVVKFGDGNITWTEASPHKYTLERGKMAGGEVTLADEVPVDVNLTATFDTVAYSSFDPATNAYTKAGHGYTVEDIIRGGKPTADGIPTLKSVDADSCKPYACEMVLEFDPATLYGAACVSGDAGVTYTFSPFRAESCQFDPKNGTIQVQGKVAAVRIPRT